VLSTLVFHALLLGILLFVSILPVPSPPEEVLITLEPDETEMVIKKQPRVTNPAPVTSPTKENISLTKPVPAVRQPAKPAAPQEAVNRVPTTEPSGTTGDVARFEPTPEPEKQTINPQALFQSDAADDPNATPQSGAKIREEALYHGSDNSAKLNTNASNGRDNDGPSFSLAGRSAMGQMPLPEYSENLQGRVVVDITVDEKGIVTSARATAQGSTVQHAKLWEAARQAALKTRFTPSATEMVQYGTITYIFKLK
jgi:TonB family protein